MTVRTCAVCKGVGMEIFTEPDGTERLGAGLCPACDGQPYYNEEAEEPE